MNSDKKKARINENIRVPEVRLVAEDGAQIGIVTVEEALDKAKSVSLDLVEVSPNMTPPVCRIMDYGKYLFELRKKRAAAKKKQRQIQIKEIKLRPGTEDGDYAVKLRNAVRFLEHGDKVKVTLRFRGREMLHQDLGRELLQRLAQDLAEYGTVEQNPRLDGRQMVMLVVPKKS